MAVQFAVSTRNAMGQAIETDIGASPIMLLRTGAKPTNLTDPSTGTVVSTINLPADWLLAPANGVVAKSGTWDDASADAGGTIGHYEIRANDGTTVKARGTVTATGGGGDMEVDNTVVNAGQQVTVTAFSWTVQNI